MGKTEDFTKYTTKELCQAAYSNHLERADINQLVWELAQRLEGERSFNLALQAENKTLKQALSKF